FLSRLRVNPCYPLSPLCLFFSLYLAPSLFPFDFPSSSSLLRAFFRLVRFSFSSMAQIRCRAVLCFALPLSLHSPQCNPRLKERTDASLSLKQCSLHTHTHTHTHSPTKPGDETLLLVCEKQMWMDVCVCVCVCERERERERERLLQ